MDLSLGSPTLDPSPLPPTVDPAIDNTPITPITKPSKKRKLSSYSGSQNGEDEMLAVRAAAATPASGRRSRAPGTKRACNQCRQQKLKCNVVESPWTDCDRCQKHNLRCEITADFKRVGKRSMQAELEKSNSYLAQENDMLKRLLQQYQDRGELPMYKDFTPQPMSDREQSHVLTHDDESHDAALLLNLKQGHDVAGPRTTPPGPHRRLGERGLSAEKIRLLWDEYFEHYHDFLPILDSIKDSPDSVHEQSDFLFWTIVLIGSRHFQDDPGLLQRLMPAYSDLIRDTICKPPTSHHVVKALCLVCTWPPPVSSTSSDMAFLLSGVMMKFAMHLGLHRPSHPMDFSRTRVHLRDEDVRDRLQTWLACNLVAQNVSTGYGQPPDTVYDATLGQPMSDATFQTRLEIEKLADKITRTVYSPQLHHSGSVDDSPSLHVKAAILAQDLQRLDSIADLSIALNRLYALAIHLHLRLSVFFDDPSSPNYQLSLNELYSSAKSFLGCAFSCGKDLKYAPNYILQIMLAAAVALLKLLNSFFAQFVDRDAGEQLFWDTITAIRDMSVKTNDLPQRFAEVFAQMWKADAERTANTFVPDVTKIGEAGIEDSSLSLKRRSRMSMSHVFDSVWNWRDEIRGKVREEKLEAAIKNPTSPQALTHRGSFSNGRRPSDLVEDSANAALSAMSGFGGFGGLPLGTGDYGNEYQFFDPMGWYLDGMWGPVTSGSEAYQ